MKLIFVALVLVFFLSPYMAAPDNLAEIPNQRAKRADCDSTFGDWSEWTTCDKDCGFCGTQSRSRVCTSSSGCDCTGETTESQACSTSDTICLAPSASCCPHTYIKKVDILNRRFFCGLE